jgi:hypothetical protein
MSALNADKGLANGSCNRTACQAPLAHELEHQFMEGIFTGGPRLHYCEKCAADFDSWDFRSGDRVRITREAKAIAIAIAISTATRNSGDEG